MSLLCKLFGHKMSITPRPVIANVGTYLAYCCERTNSDGTTACFHREPASQNDEEMMDKQAQFARLLRMRSC
jgi:hypothetical protein